MNVEQRGADQWHADSTGVDAKLHHLGAAGAGLRLLARSSECRHRRLVAEGPHFVRHDDRNGEENLHERHRAALGSRCSFPHTGEFLLLGQDWLKLHPKCSVSGCSLAAPAWFSAPNTVS